MAVETLHLREEQHKESVALFKAAQEIRDKAIPEEARKESSARQGQVREPRVCHLCFDEAEDEMESSAIQGQAENPKESSGSQGQANDSKESSGSQGQVEDPKETVGNDRKDQDEKERAEEQYQKALEHMGAAQHLGYHALHDVNDCIYALIEAESRHPLVTRVMFRYVAARPMGSVELDELMTKFIATVANRRN